MIITTRFVPKNRDAFSVWPFVFIKPEKNNDQRLIEHEKLQCKEQKYFLVLPWLLCYWLSKKFRLGAELRVYRRQVKSKDITVGKAAHQLSKSNFGLSYIGAVKELRRKAA